MIDDQHEVLIDADRLRARVSELAAELSRDYEGKDVLLLCVLKGAVLFLSDLMRELTIPYEIDFMAVSSYGEATRTSGVVKLLKDLDRPIAGRDVVIVEDIVDSGLTLDYLKRLLEERGPTSVRVCALLTKPSRRQVPLDPDYVGFEIPDRFVVGYGLDHAEQLRGLPYIAALDGGE